MGESPNRPRANDDTNDDQISDETGLTIFKKINSNKMSKIYDLAILGGGPAGYVAAERAGAKGLSVVVFDMRSLGGVCLNEGCIPTKTLLNSAKVLEYAHEANKYGINVENVSVDFKKIMLRKDKVVR